MKRFFHKRLPAMLLALVLMLGTVPLAAADETGQPGHQHTYLDSWVADGPGSHSRACTTCFQKDYQSHTYGAWTTERAATCSQDGLEVQVCTVCGYRNERPLARLTHTFTAYTYKDNTYHARSCTLCGISETQKHTPNGSGTVVINPTCTTSGQRNYVCSVCGGTYTETIPALSHTDNNGDGFCDNCGVSMGTRVPVNFYTLSGTSSQTVSLGGYPTTPSIPLTVVSGGRTYTFRGWTQTYTSDYIYTNQPLVTPSSIRITSSGFNFYALYSVSSSSGNAFTYTVAPGGLKYFNVNDFSNGLGTVWYVEFGINSNSYSSFTGTVSLGNRTLSWNELTSYRFYVANSGYGNYALADLALTAPSYAWESSVTLSYTAYGSNGTVTGSVTLKVSNSASGGTIVKELAPGGQLKLDQDDFSSFFRKSYPNYSLQYVTFGLPATSAFNDVTLYYLYGSWGQTILSRSNISSYTFYYGNVNSSLYRLDSLTLVADGDFDEEIQIPFRASYDTQRYVDGTLVIKPKEVVKANLSGDIRYAATYNSKVQINAYDIARYFNKSYPGYTLQYVVLGGVPTTGSLYYNYYGASKYGTASPLQLTSSNYNSQVLYFSPSSTAQYALTELTYVTSGYNYCAAIPFTAYGSNARSVSGTILISVNPSTVSEVYGVTQRNSSVTFPASSMYSAVSTATGVSLSSIQLLSLPAASQGTVYVGTGTATRATTDALYGYSTGTQRMNQLRFVPASTFTGSVEIPYVAYNSSGTAFAVGLFSLGVLNNPRTFKDVSSSTWCYKYVVELSDANVIDGYADGSFKPDSTVTYGAALKLIMLAAGYPEQAPVNANVFSGYLAKARAEGIITRSDVDLTKPITRLQVAQIATGAMKLNTTNLTSVQPFTDTTDPAVRALNAAGIVEGYFNNGTSTYKPGNTLTRGQLSAIVWRMEQYRK